jgi:bacteriorhodopsin
MDTIDMTTFWFWFGFVGLSLGSLGILLFASKFRREDRFHALIALTVTSIATISYYALARGQADITVGGDVVVYGRYLDWLFTTPLLLLSLLVIALPPLKDLRMTRERISLIAAVLVSDVLMIVTGLFADLSTNSLDTTVWYLASCGWFLVVLYLMFGEVQRQAFEHSERSGKVYRSLLLFLTVAWVCYPIVWILGGTGYGTINANTEAAAYAILDVSAKGIFGILTLVLLKKLEGKVRPGHKTTTVDASNT